MDGFDAAFDAAMGGNEGAKVYSVVVYLADEHVKRMRKTDPMSFVQPLSSLTATLLPVDSVEKIVELSGFKSWTPMDGCRNFNGPNERENRNDFGISESDDDTSSDEEEEEKDEHPKRRRVLVRCGLEHPVTRAEISTMPTIRTQYHVDMENKGSEPPVLKITTEKVLRLIKEQRIGLVDLGNATGTGFSGHLNHMMIVVENAQRIACSQRVIATAATPLHQSLKQCLLYDPNRLSPWQFYRRDSERMPLPSKEFQGFFYTLVWSITHQQVLIAMIYGNRLQVSEVYHWMVPTVEEARFLVADALFDKNANIKWTCFRTVPEVTMNKWNANRERRNLFFARERPELPVD